MFTGNNAAKRSRWNRSTIVRRIAAGGIALDVAAAALNADRPLLANVIVTRRCNLSCGYCHEYDKISPPVPLSALKDRIDHLARLGTIFVTLTGGETLLHPAIVEVVSHTRERGLVPLMNTNGYLLTREKILSLNDAGLYGMQISIDNVRPNETTVKSLKPLRSKLRLLAEHATFRVRVSTVLGSGSPEEAIDVARAALALGFDAKCQLVRDGDGAFVDLDERTRHAYDEIRNMGRRSPRYLSEDFQTRLMRDGTVEWKCRAGARYFHVCENGTVQFCSARADTPGIPITDYTVADIRQAFHRKKRCAESCTQPYAHQISQLDAWRSQRDSDSDLDEAGRVRLPVIQSRVRGACAA